MIYKSRIELLKIKPIRNLLLGNLITVSGGAMTYIALTWYVLQLNNSLTSIIILAVCFWTPSVFLAPIAGYIVDRFNRKKTYVLCNLIRALAVFIVALAIIMFAKNNTEKLYLCYALNLVTGIIFSFIMPAATALTREIVEDKDLLNTNSMIDMSFEIGNVAGMGFTTMFLITVGAVHCLFITSVVIILGAVFLALVKVTDEHHTGKTDNSALKEIAIGVKFLINNKYLLFLNLAGIALMVQFMITPVLLAPFVRNILHSQARQFSAIE
ncbi:MAG: MFS transporter, partial [Candidatus Thioglobus sp.]